MVAIGLGKNTADLTEADLPAIRKKLFAMKASAKQIGEVVSSQTAIATGEVDVLVGGGEWVTAGLTTEIPELDRVLPEQGGVRWSQSIGVFASSAKPDLAPEFVKYILSPRGSGAPCHVVVLLGDAGQREGGGASDRSAEAGPALGRPARLPRASWPMETSSIWVIGNSRFFTRRDIHRAGLRCGKRTRESCSRAIPCMTDRWSRMPITPTLATTTSA